MDKVVDINIRKSVISDDSEKCLHIKMEDGYVKCPSTDLRTLDQVMFCLERGVPISLKGLAIALESYSFAESKEIALMLGVHYIDGDCFPLSDEEGLVERVIESEEQ